MYTKLNNDRKINYLHTNNINMIQTDINHDSRDICNIRKNMTQHMIHKKMVRNIIIDTNKIFNIKRDHII